jgi:hypothetical protein
MLPGALDTPTPNSEEAYFVVDAVGGGGVIEIAGCGGWSKRQTLFGSDQASGREDRLLDPLRENA